MARLPKIRVSAQVPFPAMVTGAGGIALAKNNGVWQISLSITAFGTQTPPPPNFATDYLLGYDTVAQTFFKISLANLIQTTTPPRAQRLVTVSPIVVNSSDQIINVNISTVSPSCTLPAASSRLGNPVTFKDVGGNFAAHPLTITPFAGDNIDGGGAITLNINRQSITLVPANDGTTVGWSIEQ